MPYQPERTTVNQRFQIGAESNSALGTAVPAGKVLECFDIAFSINGDVSFYTPTGRKYPNTQEENTEWADAALSGNFDYNGVIYLLASVMGATTPVAHGSSSVAKDWVFTPPLTSPSVVPQTYTAQQGDSVRAHQASYLLFNQFGYTGTRKDLTCSATAIAQPLVDGITMTASPTAIPLAPVVAKQVNIFLDPTYAALGTTLLTRVLSITYNMGNVYGPLWVFNRTTVGYAAHVDLVPAVTFKIKVEADSNGMALLGYLQQGTTMFLRVQGQGNVIDNNQTVALGSPSAGTFTLTYKGQTTTAIAYNATAATVQTAFLALSTVGAGNATVTGSAGGPYTIAFAGTLATDATAVTGNGASLTGGTFLITQTQVYTAFIHDMAVKFNKPTAFGDDQGVFAIEWEAMIVEDQGWAKSQMVTVTNLLTAL